MPDAVIADKAAKTKTARLILGPNAESSLEVPKHGAAQIPLRPDKNGAKSMLRPVHKMTRIGTQMEYKWMFP